MRDSGHMGLISCQRARVGKRQARAATRTSRRLSGALDEVRHENQGLVEVFERQAAMVEELERQLDELRTRLEDG